jgi:hypothetical protein
LIGSTSQPILKTKIDYPNITTKEIFKMDRKKGILAAGTFTGLILITILALGFGNFQASAAGEGVSMPNTAETAYR